MGRGRLRLGVNQNLFIDTNIFLSFYHLTSEDLEELRKLAVLLDQKKISLHLTEQVQTEFAGNRENKIADAVKRLTDQRLSLQFPQVCKDYSEYEELRELQKEYESVHASLLEKIARDVAERTLKADKTIQELFEKAIVLPTTPELVTKARLRSDLGNPPGKERSLGEAINWEALLEKVPEDGPLYFITDDRDYVSVADENSLKDFLLEEWSRYKQCDLVFYRRLSSFFKDKFPEIKLASELEKELLIRDLTNSPNFAQTHKVISRLSKFTEFTTAQVNEIAQAGISNNQIRWIIDDPDVEAFFKAIAQRKTVDPDVRKELGRLLVKPAKSDAVEEPDDDEIPF
jgi:predicted nucleic acid-binding protein